MSWKYDDFCEPAAETYKERGFVAFDNLFTPEEFSALRQGVEEACGDGRLTISRDEMPNNNDCVFAHPAIEAAARNPKILKVARALIGQAVNLQHSKLNAKPLEDFGMGAVVWHQDYPYFPHTNYDLVACLIHLDDEDVDSGPLRCIDGSHRWGPVSHEDTAGRFAYRATGRDDLDSLPSTLLTGKAGMVTFHHSLMMHCSAPKARAGHRRFVCLQYKARDAHQIAGAIWRCYGMEFDDYSKEPSRARFADGSIVELRGIGGRLFDIGGNFAPDRKGPHEAQNARINLSLTA
jgi:hypothetical protein